MLQVKVKRLCPSVKFLQTLALYTAALPPPPPRKGRAARRPAAPLGRRRRSEEITSLIFFTFHNGTGPNQVPCVLLYLQPVGVTLWHCGEAVTGGGGGR